MLLSRSSLAREDTPKIVYAMLSGKSESHAHTLTPIITSFKRGFLFLIHTKNGREALTSIHLKQTGIFAAR